MVNLDNQYSIYLLSGGGVMTYRNLVMINGEAVDIRKLQPEDRKRLELFWARRSAAAIGYKEVAKSRQ